jgi:hypothetical protein
MSREYISEPATDKSSNFTTVEQGADRGDATAQHLCSLCLLTGKDAVEEVPSIISNYEPIKEMLMVNSDMVSVFCLVKVFQLIHEVLHIISNSQLITEMLLVKSDMVNVFGMAKVFQLI